MKINFRVFRTYHLEIECSNKVDWPTLIDLWFNIRGPKMDHRGLMLGAQAGKFKFDFSICSSEHVQGGDWEVIEEDDTCCDERRGL